MLTDSTPAADRVVTSFGVLDVAPQLGEKLIPVNLGTGPAAFAFNLRVSRSIWSGTEDRSERVECGWNGWRTSRRWRRRTTRRTSGRRPRPRRIWRRWTRRTGRNVRAHQHRPQILAELQRAGAEPVQQYRLRSTDGNDHSDANSATGLNGPGHQFGHSTSLAGRNVQFRRRCPAHICAGRVLVLIDWGARKAGAKCSGLFPFV